VSQSKMAQSISSGYTWIYPATKSFSSSLCGSGSKPCTPGEHQNSWDLWMFIPLKMVLIGIDS
jgi:hypothetical protein